MEGLNKLLDWKPLKGSHAFPGPDGGTCVNEAAIVAAGFEYRRVKCADDCPRCFSRPIAAFAMQVNDALPSDRRQDLIPFIPRLAGSADFLEVEIERAEFLAWKAIRIFAPIALWTAGLLERADRLANFQGALRQAARVCENVALAARAEGKLASEEEAEAFELTARAVGAAGGAAEFVWAANEAVRTGQLPRALEKAQIAAKVAGAAAAHTFELVGTSEICDAMIATLDGVLAIGRQAEPIEIALIQHRMNEAKLMAAV